MLVSLRLYVSPKKQVADTGPESPMKWCRQALDHKTPETELACRTLISRLDQSECYTSVYFFLFSTVDAPAGTPSLILNSLSMQIEGAV